MNELAKADIFFFITTIAVIVVGLAATIFLIYLSLVLRRIKDIADLAKSQAAAINEDINDLRSEVREKGASLKSIAGFMARTAKRHTKRK